MVLSKTARPLRLLHANELACVDQILSGTELLLKQQMLQRRNPGRHLRQYDINLLGANPPTVGSSPNPLASQGIFSSPDQPFDLAPSSVEQFF